MIFHVVAPLAVEAALVSAQRDEVAQRDPRPQRSPRRRQTTTERYHELLPRWMRAGGKGGQRIGSKQNGGGRT